MAGTTRRTSEDIALAAVPRSGATYGDIAAIFLIGYQNALSANGEKVAHAAYVKEAGRIAADIFGISTSGLGWDVDESYARLASEIEGSGKLGCPIEAAEIGRLSAPLERSYNNKKKLLAFEEGPAAIHKARLDMLRVVKNGR